MKDEQAKRNNDPGHKKSKPLKTNPINKEDLEKGENETPLPKKEEPVKDPAKKQELNKDEKITNDDNRVTNKSAEGDGNKLTPGKTTDPEISPEEKKEIKTRIHTSPGNENVPE